MRIASFGDLHLGPAPGRERFVQQEERLEALCSHLEATHDRVVLIGDVYQADCGWRLGSDPRLVSQIQRRFPRLSRRWVQPQYASIPGNHDALSPPAQLRFTAHGRIAIYRHGHAFDPISRGLSAKLTMWSMGRLRRLGLKGFCDAFEETFLDRAHRWKVGDEHLGLIDRARELLERESADIVVMGHSHRLACLRLGDGIYANSGVCRADSLAYTSVDLHRGRVEVNEFAPEGGVVSRCRVELPRRPERTIQAEPAAGRMS